MGKSAGNKKYPTGVGYDAHIISRLRREEILYINFMDLYNLAVGRFEWSGVENHHYLSTRMIEQTAITEGCVLFFVNDIMGLLALPSANAGEFDVNNIPKNRHVSRPSGFHANLTDSDSVIMFNDDTHTSFIPVIEYYAEKMTELDLTIEQNLKLQRRPKVIVTDSDNENSVKQMLNNTQDYLYPYLLQSESIIRGTDLAKQTYALDLSVPFIADKLRIEKELLRTEYLTRLGINNTRYEKKERMTNDEIAVNNEEINSYRYTALKCRREACKKVNEMFGTDLSVRYAMIEVNNGTIHNNVKGDTLPIDTGVEPTSKDSRIKPTISG